jgi:peroxiredoxin
MKSVGIATILSFILGLHPGHGQIDGYEIVVTIDKIKDNVLYLGYPYGDKKYIQDTAEAQNGHTFVFAGDSAITGGVYFIYNPNGVYFDFILNEPRFSLTTDTTDLVGKMQVKGSRENELFFNFQRFMRDKQSEARELSNRLNADKDNQQIKDRLRELNEAVQQYRSELIENNGATFAARFIQATQEIQVPDPPVDDQGKEIDPNYRYKYYKKHYFDHIDFSDPRMLRTPIFHSKMMDYLEKLTVKHPDSIIVSARHIIDKARADKDVFRYCLVTLSNKYETSNIMGMDAVFVDLAERYYLTGQAYWADDELTEKIRDRVKALKPTLIGNQAPEMVLLDTAMRQVRLSAIHSDYVVLYFYDPDCGHCKTKTPALRQLYNEKLKDMGVEVLGACTTYDKDKDNPKAIKKWKDYVKDNELNWINAADPLLRSNFRADYNIDSTPKLFVVDSNKKIIAKRLDVDQLEDFIERHQKMESAHTPG